VLYQALRFVNANYALAVFWVYVVVFVIALALIFVFPPLPLFMIFIGVACLGIFVIMSRGLTALERGLARHSLRQGTCPSCRQPNPAPALVDDHWQCVHCGAAFEPSGAMVLKT
jgi:hypothetical protein